MNQNQFEEILARVCARLTERAGESVFTNSKEFENAVRDELFGHVGQYGLKVDYDPHPHVFPDIAIGEFGVEVKFTENDTWRSVANSINEARRDHMVKYVYLLFGKMGYGKHSDRPEVRWAAYEDSVMHVRTSHMPRFEVQIGAENPLFRQLNLTYDEFRKLDVSGKMELIRTYARSRMKPGERMWWLEDQDGNDEHALNISARLYTKLDDKEKRKLRAEAALLCPQIVKDGKGGRNPDKYDDAVLFILTYHGVLCHQGRDLFTAGSVSPARFKPQCGDSHICRSLIDIQDEIIEAAARLEDALFTEYWGKITQRERRLKEWLTKLDDFADGWIPSLQLEKIRELSGL